MTILYPLLVLLATMLATTITSLYDLTISLFTSLFDVIANEQTCCIILIVMEYPSECMDIYFRVKKLKWTYG